MTDKQKSILAMLISALGFSIMGVFIKLTGDIPIAQKVLFRTYTIAVVSFLLIRMSGLASQKITHHKLLLLRSALGTIGLLLNFYSLDRLILSDANVIFRLSSVFVIILSWIFLGERISKKQFFIISSAFIGVLFIMKPEFSFRLIPYLIAIAGAFSAAAAYTTLRPLGKVVSPMIVVFYFAVFSSLVLTPYVLLNFAPMTFAQVVFAVLAGLGGVLGQVGVTFAYKFAPAKEVSIYNYFGVVFSAIFSIIIFDSVPDGFSIIGYVIVFISSYIMYQSNKKEVLPK
ncbi:MAG TPA: EamA family transporter [Eubacteriaceae bacterium]|nr:EamA family transporter [Eubacteriaceae bacterium]